MRCRSCNQGDRRPVRRAKLAERDARFAVVLDVPMEKCGACGERWLSWDVARSLEEVVTAILGADVEIGIRHFDGPGAGVA
ncbi:MAG TPA: YgiT-type zinc finger protein [Acidimicrobiales bacterium]|nr:YgiT-type zinc finger protein [Acidimicrobiales bacterium]